LQWGIGCLVGGAALGGTLILVLVIAFLVQPPVWLQILLGVTMAAGATVFTWLFTSALRRSDQAGRPSRPVAVGEARQRNTEGPSKG
jgi:threonine/homoserine/homoserine lactone efflux protein